MSSAIPFWRDDSKTWDTLKVGKQDVPGIARVSFKPPPRLDVRKPPKSHYARLVDMGRPPYEGTIEITLGYESSTGGGSEQWDRWLALEQSVFGKKPTTRNAVKVSHPEFARKGITQVYLGDPGPLEGDGPGTRKITIQWWEFGKVLPASAGSVSAAAPATPKQPTNVKALGTKPSTTNTGT